MQKFHSRPTIGVGVVLQQIQIREADYIGTELNCDHGMIKVNIQDAKTHLSRYIDRVEQGDVVVVCRHNRPVAELRAIETSLVHPTRVAGLLKGLVHWEPDTFAPMTSGALAEFDGAPVFPQSGPA